jgi:DNA-directed RNA polymerase specialized sigma24 family protein
MSQTNDPFDNVDWEDLHRRLLEVAIRLSMLISSEDKVLLGSGFSAADLVSDTIAKALGGDEIRYQASRGQLFNLLKTAMVRDFLDLRKKRSHQRTDHIDFAADEAEKDKRLRDRDADERRDATVLLQDIRGLVQDDPKLIEYLDAVELGCEKPSEIADLCRADVKDIYNRRRRLKTKLASYFNGRAAT